MSGDGWLARHEAMSDDELRSKIDGEAKWVGGYSLDFWLRELDRRRTRAQTDELVEVNRTTAEHLEVLARATGINQRLTWASLTLAAVASIAAVLALVV